MFDLYVEKSPAVFKVAVLLEECGLEYRTTHVSVSQGQQHEPAFRALSPNGKIPVLVDHAPAGGGAPITIFESGAILVYLSEKTGLFLPTDVRRRAEVMQWHFWQSTGLSPMSGQAIHFLRYAPEEARPYGLLRYTNEVRRLYGVLDRRLEGRSFICDDYSIADIGTYPWTIYHDRLGLDLAGFPELRRWQQSISQRPAVQRAYQRSESELPPVPAPTEEVYRNLFGETASAMKVN
jgi:GST-like protein